MSRYIDADRIDWRLIIPTEPTTAEEHMIYRARKLVESQPAADVVEVVRCKECVNWQIEWLTSCKKDNYHYCADIDNTCEADFFCAFAERRTNEV